MRREWTDGKGGGMKGRGSSSLNNAQALQLSSPDSQKGV